MSGAMSSGVAAESGLPGDGPAMRPRDVELIRRLEAHGLTLLATAVAQRLQVMTSSAGQPAASQTSPDLVLRNGGWRQDETVATDPGGRGHHAGQSRRSLRERQRVS